MKKALFPFVLSFLGIFSFSQTLHKGNLIGLHVSTPDLQQGVTMEEYVKFVTVS